MKINKFSKKNIKKYKKFKKLKTIKGGGKIIDDCYHFDNDDIRSDGNCFYDSVFQSAKSEGILQLFDFCKDDLNMSRDEFTNKLRKYISDNISIIPNMETLFNENKLNYSIYGYNKHDSFGYTAINNGNFEDYKKNISDITKKLWVTQYETKALGLLLQNKTKPNDYVNGSHIMYISNTKENACRLYVPGRLNIWTNNTHYHAISKPWISLGMTIDEYKVNVLKYKKYKNTSEPWKVFGFQSKEEYNNAMKIHKQVRKSTTS